MGLIRRYVSVWPVWRTATLPAEPGLLSRANRSSVAQTRLSPGPGVTWAFLQFLLSFLPSIRDPRNVGKAGCIAFMLSYNYPVEETFEMATLTQASESVLM